MSSAVQEHPRRRLLPPLLEGDDLRARQLLMGAAALMIAAHLVLRGWAVFPSWFFTDDYRLMYDAQRHGLTWGYLVAPFDSNFMPGARLLVWLVTVTGPFNWLLAASTTLVLQAVADVACLWMLVTLFGRRWGVLVPFGVYLTSVITAPAFMWWAAAVNQIPFQIAFFLALGWWVRYLREPRPRNLVIAVVAVLGGLVFYEKALLVLPVLGYLMVAYFSTGPLRARLLTALRRFWLASVLALVMASSYLLFYRAAVPQPFRDSGRPLAGEVADAMLGTSLASGLIGGPWRWWRTSPPIVLASPPTWSIHLAWVVIVVAVLFSALRRQRTLRGWALLAGYAVALYLLLLTSRGQTYGRLAGLEYRYLTDLACVLSLTIGLVFLGLRGAPDTSQPRERPLVELPYSRRAGAVLVSLVLAGGLVSTVRYVGYWHRDNASQEYVQNLRASLASQDRVPDLAEQVIPAAVMPPYTKPYNDSQRFLQLFGQEVRFPATSGRLQVLNDQGSLEPAHIKTGVTSLPGPSEGCGWKVLARGRTIRLSGETFDWTWWLRIGYLSSVDSPVSVSAGSTTRVASVRRGLHSLYVRAPGRFDSVTISGLAPGTTLCVDTIEVGDPVTEGALG